MTRPSVLHYAMMPTKVGSVFVVMSHSGVVDIVFDACDPVSGEPTGVLESRFPKIRMIADDGSRGEWAAAAVARIDGTRSDAHAAPIDLAWSAVAAHKVSVATPPGRAS
jgi:hypothetical protein